MASCRPRKRCALHGADLKPRAELSRPKDADYLDIAGRGVVGRIRLHIVHDHIALDRSLAHTGVLAERP